MSVIRTVVIPRPERVWLTTTSFELARRAAQAVARRIANPARRHRVLGTFEPVVIDAEVVSVGVACDFALFGRETSGRGAPDRAVLVIVLDHVYFFRGGRRYGL